jgi:hypothetical protein
MSIGRKIAVNLHRMWLDEKDFDPQMSVDEFCPLEASIETKKEIKKEEMQVKALIKERAKNKKVA